MDKENIDYKYGIFSGMALTFIFNIVTVLLMKDKLSFILINFVLFLIMGFMTFFMYKKKRKQNVNK